MEIEIINEAINGDLKAFRKIFDFYLPRMRPIALRYTRTSFEADDVLQEVFIKVYHNLKKYRFEGSFEGWIRKIVVNTALNYQKKNLQDLIIEPIDFAMSEGLDFANLIEIEEAESSQILKVISELPPGYRAVFNLYVFEEYSHKEIGEMLGISEAASRSQYFKSKKMITRLLSGKERSILPNVEYGK